MTRTLDYLPSRDGLALLTGGPTQAGYAASALAYPSQIWMPRHPWVAQAGGGSVLDTDTIGFVDPEAGGWSPFEINGGGNLLIKLRKAVDVGVTLNNQYTDTPVEWVSGFLCTRHRLTQTHGVFETRMRVPSGANLLPAFWLLAEDETWPPEIYTEWDGEAEQAFLGTVTTGPLRIDNSVTVSGLDDGAMHEWVIKWRAGLAQLWIDGTLASSQDLGTRPISESMYLIVSFGILGTTDGTTPTTADVEVEHVRAWRYAA